MITEIPVSAAIGLLTVLASVLALRLLSSDLHYATHGFGTMTQSAANAFSSALVTSNIEPDLIVVEGKGNRRLLDLQISDILVWDVREWFPHLTWSPDIASAGDVVQTANAGLTKDNSADAREGPTTFATAQGTKPGGAGAAVTGTAGVQGSAPTVGDEVMPFEALWDYGMISNETVDATGQANHGGMKRMPHESCSYQRYEVEGNSAYHLLTAAHYWVWINTEALAAAASIALGGSVRRVSVDLDEVMFDREVVISILTALAL